MTPEHALINQIRIECGKLGYIVIRMNIFKGQMIMPNGDIRHIESGIPKGFPDLMILRTNGEACFIETKIHPRKPTSDQVKVQKILCNLGFKAGTVYSLKEALNLIGV